ncbi:MAG: copper amine oxidase N-terminal domain-containing protein [Paenibacillaceae bacterium]
MKKNFLLALMLLIVLSFTPANVFAAAAQPKQIDVFVDNDQIVFNVNPVIESGSTLVQFKPVFEKLGLEIVWDAKTKKVTGSSKDLNIELTIGSKNVLVNGTKKQVTVAPKIINGVTMVPLRFIGEASGRDVSWDGRTKTVYVATTEEQVYFATALYYTYLDDKDVEGVLTIFDPSTIVPDTKASFEQFFSDFDLDYELEKMELISLEKETASLEVTVKTTKITGPEFEDNRTILILNLNNVKGEWKVYTLQDTNIDYLRDDLRKEEVVTLSAEDQTQVLAVIEKNRDAGIKGDLEALKSTYDSSTPYYEKSLSNFQQITAAGLKVDVTYSNVKIVKGADDEAKIYYMAHVHKVSGPDIPDMNIESVDTVKKNKDGEWKITNSADLTTEIL